MAGGRSRKEPIGAGKEAEAFARGPNVLKLYRSSAPKASAFREAAALAVAGALGLPVPEVLEVGRFGGRWGIVMTRAAGPAFAEAMASAPEAVPVHLAAMARLHRRLHDQPGTRLPSLRARLAADIARAEFLRIAHRRRLVEGLAALAGTDRLCHGDFHPWNLLGPPEAPVVIDWLDAACGAPEADACRTHVLLHPVWPDLARDYLAAYAAAGGAAPEVVLAWRPFVAAARLAEGVPEVEALVAMAEEAP
jgi:aminoglycoside phosphotransferase (APT) family kinase protein